LAVAVVLDIAALEIVVGRQVQELEVLEAAVELVSLVVQILGDLIPLDKVLLVVLGLPIVYMVAVAVVAQVLLAVLAHLLQVALVVRA
jgi:hypothetical protein